jgi:hypothetical protein
VKDFPVINKGQEHSRELQDLFMRVVKTYAAIKELPTVAAINYDAEAPSRSKILTVNGIHFIADVERVTERALKNAPLLQVGWFALAKDKPISPTIARQVIARTAPLYLKYGLSPLEYFARLRRSPATRRAA